MFQRYHNLKRGAALFGAILALLSGMGNTHWMCQLGGCATEAADDLCVYQDSQLVKSCPHSHGCNAASEASHSDPEPRHEKHDRSSCPCPPDCWCNQTPQPLELPKSTTDTSELLTLTLSQSEVVIAIVACDALDSPFNQGEVPDQSASSTQRCAQLCRFLI